MNFWLIISLLALGFSGGLFVGAKYINTPGNEFNLKKIKVKGQNNVVIPKITQTSADQQKPERKGILKRIFKRKNNGKTQ